MLGNNYPRCQIRSAIGSHINYDLMIMLGLDIPDPSVVLSSWLASIEIRRGFPSSLRFLRMHPPDPKVGPELSGFQLRGLSHLN